MAGQRADFSRQFKEQLPLFERLGRRIVDSLTDLLEQEGIATLDIAQRTKSWESFSEKIDRKGYLDPFNEVEDFCGVRLICYYPSDVDKIVNVVRREFEVTTEENTATRLAPHEFGYRSTHLIVRMKPEWLHVPAHRGLQGFKAEIQVRTVLMHAWAEIQHKLAYKSQDQVPDIFQRQLYRLSAKFEEADEQFDQLRRDLEQYRIEFAQTRQTAKLSEIELNLDNLSEFLGITFSERAASRNEAASLLDEIKQLGVNFEDLFNYIEKQKRVIHLIEKERVNSWSQVGAMRNALDISNDKYFETRKEAMYPESWLTTVQKCRNALARSG